jgi:CBS domain-containing protein
LKKAKPVNRSDKAMITVHDLLRIKGDQVWTISPYASVLETLKLMAEKDIGALLVVDADEIVGVISERDLVRSFAKTETCFLDLEIQNYMTRGVITINPSQSIDECMQLMTKEKIRHLPVVENQKLVGLISMRDVVKEILSSKESTITSLEDYIEGRGYGH